MAIKALLVAVSEYKVTGCSDLPLCKNDLYAMQNALIKGLKVEFNDIYLCGETGSVNKVDFLFGINKTIENSTEEDTVIFYFSGHGGENILALTDVLIELQEVINLIENVKAKNKVILLDCCHAGGFEINNTQIGIIDSIEKFLGVGCAVLASCGAEEVSGFNVERRLSLYTSFLCDALTNKMLIRKGRKTLEAIVEAVWQYANAWNRRGKGNIQRPIFRSNVGGTIFFEVKDYKPYQVAQVYEETDKYIIYEVEPVHHGQAKRLAVKVILRYESSLEQVAEIADEIKCKILYYEVHQNQRAEAYHRGKPANIVWCYFGYDEDDMVNSNFICHTTWVDDSQDKLHWYRQRKHSCFINEVYISEHESYELIKSMKTEKMTRDELIRVTKKYTDEMIRLGEQCICIYREYVNGTMSEEELIRQIEPFNKQILRLYFKQGELPIPPNELNEWAQAHVNIAGTIHDLTLFYNKNNLDKWTSQNRSWLMTNTIKRYQNDLKRLAELEKE